MPQTSHANTPGRRLRVVGFFAVLACLADHASAAEPADQSRTYVRSLLDYAAALEADARADRDAEARLLREGHSSAVRVAAQDRRVATAAARVAACRRHLDFLDERAFVNPSDSRHPTAAAGHAAFVASNPAADALRETWQALQDARARELSPMLELHRQRLTRLRAAAKVGAAPPREIERQQHLVTRLRAMQSAIRARPPADRMAATQTDADLSDRIAAHWQACLREASTGEASQPPTIGPTDSVDRLARLDAVRRLVADDPFFAGEASALADRNEIDGRRSVLRVAADREAAAVARAAGPVDAAGRWLAVHSSGDVADARRNRLAAAEALIMAEYAASVRRVAALRTLHSEGFAAWDELAMAEATADTLSARRETLRRQRQTADAQQTLAARLRDATPLAAVDRQR